jgi:hypothetical protein
MVTGQDLGTRGVQSCASWVGLRSLTSQHRHEDCISKAGCRGQLW